MNSLLNSILCIITALLLVIIHYIGQASNMTKRTITSGGSYDSNLAIRIRTPLNKASTEFRDTYMKLMKDVTQLNNIKPPILVTDIQNSLPYTDQMKLYKTSIHIGQRKLFLSELQFLTKITSDMGLDNPRIVYAGAAPGTHLNLLTKLFPAVRFLLIDPNPFGVKHGRNISSEQVSDYFDDDSEARFHIINEYFTDELAAAIAKNAQDKKIQIYFISDIRTNSAENEPSDNDIIYNMAQQMIWVDIIKPALSMLKWRYPFYTGGEINPEEPIYMKCNEQLHVDFVGDMRRKHLTYFAGDLYVQAWPGPSSTEVRLVTDGKIIRDHSHVSGFEDPLFYYNSIERPYGHHNNPNADRGLGFDHCADCALENIIWEDYIALAEKRGWDHKGVRQYVVLLCKNTGRKLLHDGHGRLFKKLVF